MEFSKTIRWLSSRFMHSRTGFRERFLKGAAAVLVSGAYAQGLRLLGNLLLTRMLYPEAFGLMVIVNLLFAALHMFSDVGIRDALISSTNQIDQETLDTAWSLMIVRGVILSLVAMLLAQPLALFYQDPVLFQLVFVVALSPLIAGFTSPYPIVQEKKVQIVRVVVWQVGAQTLALGGTIIWVTISPTVWGLAAHGVIAALVSTILSHILFVGKRPLFRIDKRISKSIFKFGKWILLATAFTFLARQGDALLASRWATASQLGIFSIALSLSKMVELVTHNLGMRLLMPVYAELKTGSKEIFHARMHKIKIGIFVLTFPIIVVFSIFGQQIVEVLYDPRYYAAGWMLEIMSAGAVFVAAGAILHPVALSHGDSYRHMWMVCTIGAALVGFVSLGGHFFGFAGVIFGITFAQVADYIIVRIVAHHYGIRDYKIDVGFIFLTLLIVFANWYVSGWPLVVLD